jgi:hypothetical protein
MFRPCKMARWGGRSSGLGHDPPTAEAYTQVMVQMDNNDTQVIA